MATFKQNIKKISRALEEKIKNINLPTNRGEWEGGRGIGVNTNQPDDICPLFYSTNPNSYDIADILAGTVGPTVGDKCARLNTITGLTDFDQTTGGDDVTLIVQLDGNFD